MQSLLTNPMFSGLVGAGMVTYVMFALRNVPKLLWTIILRTISVKVTVTAVDTLLYFSFQNWLRQDNRLKYVRFFKLESNAEQLFELGVGYGTFFFVGNKSIIIINKSLIEWGMGKVDQMVVTIIGLNSKSILNECVETMMVQLGQDNRTKLYQWNDWWRVSYRHHRDMDSIYLNDGIKDDIIEDIEMFISKRDWYLEHGIPYRRGYLLYGPPGTGKTSLCRAIAGKYKKSIFILSISSMKNDNELMTAITRVEKNCVVLIEDIDCVTSTVTQVRDLTPTDKKDEKPTTGSSNGVSLSGLLNALDGVHTPEDVIFIMTTNDISKLDPALMRAGRVDKKIFMDHVSEDIASKMVDKLSPTSRHEILKTLTYPVAPSVVQNEIMAKFTAIYGTTNSASRELISK